MSNINTSSLTTLAVKSSLDNSYDSYSSRNLYTVFGLNFIIRTERNRDYGYYYTMLELPLLDEWKYEKGNAVHVEFSKWARNYIETKSKLAHGNKYYSDTLRLSTYNSDRASGKCLDEAHSTGTLIGETLLVEIINKFVEILFNHVDKEVIQQQIDKLQSQLATL